MSLWIDSNSVILRHEKSTRLAEKYSNGNTPFCKMVVYIEKEEFHGERPPKHLVFTLTERWPKEKV